MSKDIPLWCTNCEFQIEEEGHGVLGCNCTVFDSSEGLDTNYPYYWEDIQPNEPWQNRTDEPWGTDDELRDKWL